tara:strand:- start:1634 stop:2524 length:891 start_codon:yes stop_codon:yes gene_type:complete
MDNTVTAKFFIVKPQNGHSPVLESELSRIIGLDRPAREGDIGGANAAVIVRLERLDASDNGYITGELVRKQTENIPPEANNDGLTPIELSEGGGLGYSSAFCFHPETRCLLIQSNPIAVTQSRFSVYLEKMNQDAQYEFEPVVKHDAWTRFNSGAPRKLAIKIASAGTRTAHFDDEAETVAGSAAELSEALGGAYITIEVSMGSKKGSLATDRVRKVLDAFKRSNDADETDVRMLNASVKEDGSRTDIIDFLDEYLVFRDVYDLPSDDPDGNYGIRKEALKTSMKRNISYIRENYD